MINFIAMLIRYYTLEHCCILSTSVHVIKQKNSAIIKINAAIWR